MLERKQKKGYEPEQQQVENIAMFLQKIQASVQLTHATFPFSLSLSLTHATHSRFSLRLLPPLPLTLLPHTASAHTHTYVLTLEEMPHTLSLSVSLTQW